MPLMRVNIFNCIMSNSIIAPYIKNVTPTQATLVTEALTWYDRHNASYGLLRSHRNAYSHQGQIVPTKVSTIVVPNPLEYPTGVIDLITPSDKSALNLTTNINVTTRQGPTPVTHVFQDPATQTSTMLHDTTDRSEAETDSHLHLPQTTPLHDPPTIILTPLQHKRSASHKRRDRRAKHVSAPSRQTTTRTAMHGDSTSQTTELATTPDSIVHLNNCIPP